MKRCVYGALALMVYVGHVAALASGRDCTAIVSAVERLACFDQAAGTPPLSVPPAPGSTVPALPAIFALVEANEGRRQMQDHRFLLWPMVENGEGGLPLMITAPAIDTVGGRRYLAISCQSGISRLQLLLERPLTRPGVSVQLLMDRREIGRARLWRVLDDGYVVDAGRGLPAIELLKRFGQGSRLTVRSDEPQLDGLSFDAEGLLPLIEQERMACHW